MRHWKAFSTSFATLCARLSSVACLMVTNGIAARRMTPEQFGLWAILLSINFLTNGFDLGFRFTLGNRLAALGSRGVGAEEERRETFLSILFLQAAIAATGMLLILFVIPVAPWTHWFKITDPRLIAEVPLLMPVVLTLMVGSLPVALVWTVFYAYHEIKLASFLGGAANVVQMAVFIVSAYRSDFKSIILIYYVSNLVIGAILTSYVFIRRKWRFTLLPPARILTAIRSMARVSFHAFFLTISSIISQILGPIISGATSGLVVAGDFTLVQKLFSFLTSAYLGLMAPVSPAVTLESHSGNWDAVRRRLRIWVFQVCPVVFLVLGTAIWCVHPFLIRLWAGHPLRMYPLAALLLLWACLGGFASTFSVFLNSLGLVKVQAAISFGVLLPNLLLPVVLNRWIGVPGIALSMVLCTLPSVIILPAYTRRALRLHLLRV